jgi:hypothetical protein
MPTGDPIVRLNIEIPLSLRLELNSTVGWGNARRVTTALLYRFLADYKARGSLALAELLTNVPKD